MKHRSVNEIKRIAVWCWMLTKRYMRNPIIIITILAIPLAIFALRFSTGKDEAAVRVAVCAEGSDEWSIKAVDKLTDTEGKAIYFYRVESEELARREVEAGNAVCAYVFPKDFSQMIEHYVKREKSQMEFDGHLVKCIQEGKSNYSQITREMVFSTFYEKFASEILKEFMSNYKKDFSEKDWKIIQDYYYDYDIQAEFFRFEYLDGSENTLMAQQSTSFLLLPIRGLILALILLASMTGGMVAYRDKEKGLFQSIPESRRGTLNYVYLLIPTVITATVGMAGIWISKTGTNLSREIICMLLYVFLVTGVCNIIRRLSCSSLRFASIIPLYLMINIVFSPVFINLASMVPQVKHLRILLPVNYGLMSLYDYNVRAIMAVIGVIAFVIVWIGKEE